MFRHFQKTQTREGLGAVGILGWDHIQPNESVTGRIVGVIWYAADVDPLHPSTYFDDGDWSMFIMPDDPGAYENHNHVINPAPHKTLIHLGPIGSGDPPSWQKATGLVECEIQPGGNDYAAFEASFGAAAAPVASGSARRATVYGFRCEDVSHNDKVEIHSLQYIVTEPDPQTGEIFIFVYSDASTKGDKKPIWPPGAHDVVTAQVHIPMGNFTSSSETIIRSNALERRDYNHVRQGSAAYLDGTISIGSNGYYEARITLS